jgi:RNA polymerase sigma factor (sigma-70 family)
MEAAQPPMRAAFGGSGPLPSEHNDLASLMSSVAGRDRSAFKRMYDLTSARLFGVVLRIVRDRAAAEEVLQDVYLRIWERASTYRPEIAAPLAWMVSIARHRAIDTNRSRKEISVASINEDGDWLEQVADPNASGGNLEDRDGLRRCLQKLDEQQRTCLVLAYCGGYSRDELAIRYDRPVNTIKTWLHRGLAALRTCLEAQ